jgi:hypothetical protein
MWALFLFFTLPSLSALPCPLHIIGTVCHGESGYCVLNPDGSPGGFVAKTAFVRKKKLPSGQWQLLTNTISPQSALCGQARLLDEAKLLGHSFLFDRATASGQSILKDHAHVGGDANIEDQAQIAGMASIEGHVAVIHQAKVEGDAYLGGFVRVTDQAQVRGPIETTTAYHIKGNSVIESQHDLAFVTEGDTESITGESPGSLWHPCPEPLRPFLERYGKGIGELSSHMLLALSPIPTDTLTLKRVRFYEDYLKGFSEAKQWLATATYGGRCEMENEQGASLMIDVLQPSALTEAYEAYLRDWPIIEITIGRMQDALNRLAFDTSLSWRVSPQSSRTALQHLSMEFALLHQSPDWLHQQLRQTLTLFPLPPDSLLPTQAPLLFVWDPTPYRVLRDTLSRLCQVMMEQPGQPSAWHAVLKLFEQANL